MSSKAQRLFYTILISLIILIVYSCKGSESDSNSTSASAKEKVVKAPLIKLISIDKPEDGQKFASGDQINLSLSLLGDLIPDSIRVYLDGKHITTLKDNQLEFVIDSKDTRLGRVPFKVIAYSGDRRPHTLTRFVLLYSDIVPPVLSYSVLKEFPHDMGAYTQGLLVHEGVFYESTGQEGRSSLREVEIETGKVKREHKLDSKFFGEGLVLLNSRLYQLTWEHNTGFIYDLESFKVIKSIHYDTQGWGLATDGEILFMSDGTNKIYILEPDYFTVTSSFEVYDDKKAVWQLNELEYIDGELWANIYMSDLIARIDPQTGKVLSYIDFKGLLPQKDRAKLVNPEEDVLNGIAWDKDARKLYISGKRWPKLFEVKVR